MDEKIDRILQKHDAQLSQQMLEINTINHSINIFKTLIEELNVKFEQIDVLKKLHKEFNDLSVYLKGEAQAVLISLDSLKREVYQMQLKLAQSKALEEELSCKLEKVAELQEKNFQTVTSKIREADIAQSQNVEMCARKSQASLEKLKNELSISPIEIFEQNNQIMNRVESAALDGTNAMLKVNNMDMKITIVEKKMENLAIQIKKIELQAQ